MDDAAFDLAWGELRRSVKPVAELLDDPKTLRPFAKRLRDRVKKFIASEGEGSWAPYAESTRRRMEHTGTSDVTKHGVVRKSKVSRVAGRINAIEKRARKGGWTPNLRAQVEKLRKRVTALAAKENAARAKSYAARKTGKSQAETRKLMGRMPGTIRATVKKAGPGTLRVTVYSAAGDVGYYHDQGIGVPQRKIIPEPSDADMNFLADLLEGKALEAFERG